MNEFCGLAGKIDQHMQQLSARGAVRFFWKEDGAHPVEIVDYHQALNMAELLDETHPGEILLENFMKPIGILAGQLASPPAPR